jgi:hypothetical protein
LGGGCGGAKKENGIRAFWERAYPEGLFVLPRVIGTREEGKQMAVAAPKARLILTPVLKLVIAVVGLLILQALVSALPMVREIPVPSGIPLPILEIVKVVIATVILVLVVN